MTKVPKTNDTDRVMHVGPYRIMPGETRMVDASLLDPEPVEKKPAEIVVNELAQLLKGKVPDVVAALPGKTIEQLTELEGLENASAKPRAGVLQAIAAEKLRLSQPPA